MASLVHEVTGVPSGSARPRILFLDPYHSGSHAAFADTLIRHVDADWTLQTLPGRHWKWRMRGAALAMAEELDERERPDLVITTSMFPLAELVGLCPQLMSARKVIYFHENQFAYPTRADSMQHSRTPEHPPQDRDTHFGFTQIASAAAADACWFNSDYNRVSFLAGARSLLARMPDHRLQATLAAIESRAEVFYPPLEWTSSQALEGSASPGSSEGGPRILWNHRWEHDKCPEVFFDAVRSLGDRPFRLLVCGESFRQQPAAFEEARVEFAARIDHWGFCADRRAYQAVLSKADIAVSTAAHEFFGIALLEAMHAGARPLAPDRLAYRETVPDKCRYATDEALRSELARLVDCHGGQGAHGDTSRAVHREWAESFSLDAQVPRYERAISELLGARTP